jgi:hypothetical protein
MVNGWSLCGGNAGKVEQKNYFTKLQGKVGHIVKRRHVVIGRPYWVALFDGVYIGTFDVEAEAREAVDTVGNQWKESLS